MHPISSTLATMVARAEAKARHAEQLRGSPKEFEDAVYRALIELHGTRPRLVTFAPEEALQRVLSHPAVHRLTAREERPPAAARFTTVVRRMATKFALGVLVATLITGATAPAFAGKPQHGRRAGHHEQRQEQELSAARKGKSNKSKSVTRTFSNDGAIAIPAEEAADQFGPADPYPSSVDVAGFKKAKLTDVNVTLRGFAHSFPKDVNVLLVAPGGRNMVVLGDVGGAPAEAELTMTLDDEATARLSGDAILTSGSFQPLGNDPSSADDFPAPAPALSENVALSAFDGINPNGAWQLFIVDVGSGDTGRLADGWSLQITAKSKVKSKGKKKH